MEESIEPEKFDVIVVGTGFQESVVAGALSRAGRKILHVDCSAFYGSHWGCADLAFFAPWMASRGGIPPRETLAEQNRCSIAVSAEPSRGPLSASSTADGSPPSSSTSSGAPSSSEVRAAAPAAGYLPEGQEASSLAAQAERQGSAGRPSTEDGEAGSSGAHERAKDEASREEEHGNFAESIGESGREEGPAEEGAGGELLGPEPRFVPPDASELPIPSSQDGALYSHMSLRDWSKGADLGPSRAYSIDLCGPRLLQCGGSFVPLLVASGASSYLEFKAIEGLLMWNPRSGALVAIPASRADVFQDRSLSLVEKRHLMRFLKLVADFTPLSQTTPWVATHASGLSPETTASGHSNEQNAESSAARVMGPSPGDAIMGDATTDAMPSPEMSGGLRAESGATLLRAEDAGQGGETNKGTSMGEASAKDAQNARASSGGARATPHEGSDHVHPFSEYRGRTFQELLVSQKLPQALQEYILHAIVNASCMDDQLLSAAPTASSSASASHNATDVLPHQKKFAPDLSSPEGLARMALYFRSVGRFGARSGLIYPSYSCGELPQAFCRIAAVKGALYVLQRRVASLLIEKILLGPSFVPAGQQHTAFDVPSDEASEQHSSISSPSASDQVLAQPAVPAQPTVLGVARAVCIVDRSLKEGMQALLAVVPPDVADPSRKLRAVRILQVPGAFDVAPPGKFLVYASAPLFHGDGALQGDSAETLLRPAFDTLFQCSWSVAGETARLGPGPEACSSPDHDGGTLHTSTHFANEQGQGQPALEPNSDAGAGAGSYSSGEGGNAGDKDGGAGKAEDVEDDGRPRILWAAFFVQRIAQRRTLQPRLPAGAFCCSSPDASDNYEAALSEAQQIFAEMAPGEAFYPPTEQPNDEEEEDVQPMEGSRSQEEGPRKEADSGANDVQAT